MSTDQDNREDFNRLGAAGFPPRKPAPAPFDDDMDDQTISLSVKDMVPDIIIPGYTIIRELKKGGQAVIYLAVQESTGRKVAIKLIYQAKVSQEERERMEREVRVLAELDHSGIVSIIDRGCTPESWPYFVMEYIQGKTLQQWLDDYHQRHGPVGIPRDLTEILRLFSRICDTINTAHLRGIVHRDLKPGNIIIDTYGDPHILDFGLAHGAAAWLLRSEETRIYDTYEFHGSLPWASPEQAEGDVSKLDTRTDVYSLGIILFQLLTGEFPYEVFGKALDTLQHIRETPPEPPSTAIKRKLANTQQARAMGLKRTLNPIGSRLDAIVLKALEKDPSKRYQTAGEFSKEINAFLMNAPSSTGNSERQNRSLVIGLPAAVLLSAAVGFGVYYWTTLREPASEPAAASASTAPAPPPPAPAEDEQAALTKLWGYQYTEDGNTVEFEFNPSFYRKARNESGALVALPPASEIQWVNVAGTFNGWKGTDGEWLMHRQNENNYSLRKPASLFNQRQTWQFKFVLNGKIWVGPPREADNKLRVQGDSETFNFLLYSHLEDDTQLEVARLYRKNIEKAWPGMSSSLSMDDDLKYTFSMENVPPGIKIGDLEPLRGIPLKSLVMGDSFVTDFDALTAVNTLETLILGGWLHDFLFSEAHKALVRKDFNRAREVIHGFTQPYLNVPAFSRFKNLLDASIDGLESVAGQDGMPPPQARVFEGRSYLYVPIQMNWQQARAFCEKHGAHLVTLTSRGEQDWLVHELLRPGLGKPAWLGGTDSGSEGTWRWVTGENWDYQNWTGEEPNNLYGNENALLITWTGDWFDSSEINDQAAFVMEWDSVRP